MILEVVMSNIIYSGETDKDWNNYSGIYKNIAMCVYEINKKNGKTHQQCVDAVANKINKITTGIISKCAQLNSIATMYTQIDKEDAILIWQAVEALIKNKGNFPDYCIMQR